MLTKLLPVPQNLGATVSGEPELNTELCIATFTVSTPSVDADGDILIPRGCLPHMERYRANPVVLWHHDMDIPQVAMSEHPHTKQLMWYVDDLSVRAGAWFHLKTLESSQSWALVEAKVLRGASVGFDPIPDKTKRITTKAKGVQFDEWMPLEWSVCVVPVNPDALLDSINRRWDGKALSPMLTKSLRKMIPEVTSKVFPQSYVKIKMPWKDKSRVEYRQTKDADMPEEATNDEASQEQPQNPPGAQALMGAVEDVQGVIDRFQQAIASVEKEEVLACFEECGTKLAEVVNTMSETLGKIYPDAKSDSSEETTDKENEPKTEPQDKAIGKSAVIKADDGEHMTHLEACAMASELMDDMAKSANVPHTYRLACKQCGPMVKGAGAYFAKGYMKADEEAGPDEPEEDKAEDDDVKPDPEPEEKADDEIDEEEMKAIKALAEDIKTLRMDGEKRRKELAKVTGKVA